MYCFKVEKYRFITKTNSFLGGSSQKILLSPPFFIVKHAQKTLTFPAWLTTGKKVRCEDQEIIQTQFGKRFIRERNIFQIQNTIHLGDQYMNDSRKRNKN